MRQLADTGPFSSSIITYLELTGEIVTEAYEAFQDDSAAKRNLADILAATRFKQSAPNVTKCAKRIMGNGIIQSAPNASRISPILVYIRWNAAS